MRFFLLYFVALVLFAGCQPSEKEVIPLKIAVSANMRPVAEEWARSFQQREGKQVEIVSGASGTLYAQIVHGAPFQLFFSADEDYPNQLFGAGKSEKPVPYARGRLALWLSEEAYGIGVKGPAPDLRSLPLDRIVHFAIPNPESAPYGKAAKGVLQKLDNWPVIQPKIVFGESVGKTAALLQTGAAEAGITAWSLFQSSDWKIGGRVSPLPDSLHAGLLQSYVVLKTDHPHPDLPRFLAFIQSPEGQSPLMQFGYERP